MRTFLIAQLVCTIFAAAVAAAFLGQQGFVSVVLGGGVALMNSAGTAFVWPRLLEKKDVALSLSIIVSKFALSLGVFYWVFKWRLGWRLGSGASIAFALGLATVLPAAVTVAISDFCSKEDLET